MVPIASASSSPIRLYVNGRETYLPNPVVLKENRVLVPMRAYIESLGASISWLPPETVTAQIDNRTVQMTIGATEALVDGHSVSLDVPAQLIEDRTYVPLRFLSEGLGASVDWDGQSVSVDIGGGGQVQVIDGPLNVRQMPTTASLILTTVPNGTVMDQVRRDASWTQVRLPRGIQGWVANPYIRQTEAPPMVDPFRPALAQAEGFIQVGSECLGVSPMIGGRLYLPLRQTVAMLGGTSTPTAGGYEVMLGNQNLTLTLGQQEAMVDGRPVDLGAQPVLMGGQVLLPARGLANALSLPLGWSDALRTVSLGLSTPTAVCNPVVSTKAYLIMDAATGVILSEQNARVRMPIASTTKIMTGLLAVEQGDPEATVTVSQYAASQIGTSVYLRAGEQRKLRELLYGLMLVSGNDAASAIAEHLAGTEYAFVQMMNRRAIELGANDTLFYNASGLDDWVNPYSTAYDLATIAREAVQHPEFRVYMSTKSMQIPGPSGPRLLRNKNDFVQTYPTATGVKNGWTEKASYTLVTSAFRNNRELIVVLLGTTNRSDIYQQAATLMDYGFQLADRSWLLATDR